MAIPYKASDKTKKEQVAVMFNNIAHRYDFLNHFLSFGIDYYWRRRAVKKMKLLAVPNPAILDLATGTADFALAAVKTCHARVTGIDISEQMLEMGRTKILRKKRSHVIDLCLGDSENLEFKNLTFDGVMSAFGVRNFENRPRSYSEALRVLKPGGALVILEFSVPVSFPLKQLYGFYFSILLPFFGRMISRDREAYNYLHQSVTEFPWGEQFVKELNLAGFINTGYISLTGGICSIYYGSKPLVV